MPDYGTTGRVLRYPWVGPAIGVYKAMKIRILLMVKNWLRPLGPKTSQKPVAGTDLGYSVCLTLVAKKTIVGCLNEIPKSVRNKRRTP